MRAIGYFRLGEHEGRTSESLAARFHEYCYLNLHQPIAVLEAAPEDEGDSPIRPLLEHLDRVGADFLVVVDSAADLGDGLEDAVRSLVSLDRLEVRVVCMGDEYPDPVQNAIRLFGLGDARAERSGRARESMSVRALEGRALGRPPYGYRIGPSGRLEIYSSEAQVVRMIFRMYTRYGLGLRLIVQDLNRRGLTTRGGGSWSVASVRGILRNPAYIGTYTRLGMRRPNAHEAIVQAESFRAAQETARSRRPFGRVNSSRPFLMSGVAHCAYCGNGMMGVTRRSSWRRKDGERASGTYRYYQCQSRSNQGRCGYHTWREASLDEAVADELRAAAKRGPLGGGAGEPDGATASEAANAERRMLDAVRRAARGEITTRTLGEYLAELDTARQSAASPPPNAEAALTNWPSLDFDQKRALVTRLISKVIVHDDRIEVFLLPPLP